jgi:uncharacterized protein (AIM24 family)
LSVSGAASIDGEHAIASDDMDLSVSGAGSIHLECTAHEIRTRISGAGDVVVSGSCDAHTVVVSGAGDVDASGLAAKKTDVTVSGAGNCELHVLDELTATVSGTGDICYTGNPVVSQRVTGAGSVRRCAR